MENEIKKENDDGDAGGLEHVDITPRSIAAAVVTLVRRPSKSVIDYAVANSNEKSRSERRIDRSLFVCFKIYKSMNSLLQSLHHAVDDAATVAQSSSTPIYLVANGIDGPSMRGQDVQAALLTLVEKSGGKCRLIASVDHIYAPVLWDQVETSSWRDSCCFYNFSF